MSCSFPRHYPNDIVFDTMRSFPRIVALALLLSIGFWTFEGALLAGPSAQAASDEAGATLLGRFVIHNVFGWEGIPGGRLTGNIYVTLFHPRSGTSRDLVTNRKGYVTWPKAPPGLYVLKEISYEAEGISGSSRLSAPLTYLTCDVAPSSATYCGTVLYTFRRLPEGQGTYVGTVRPEKPGVQGLDILDESKDARKAFEGRSRSGRGDGLEYRTSIWTGPKGLPTWEAASHFHQGYEHSKRRRYEEAIPEFKAGLKKDPAHAWPHYMIARAHQWHGRDAEAIAEYGEALRLNPYYAKVHLNLGMLYRLKAQYGQARGEFQKAAAINPRYVPTVLYHLKKLEQIAKVEGTAFEAYHARTPEEASLLADAQAAIDAAHNSDWKTALSHFADDGRIEAHCGVCDPSKFFSVYELKDYLSQPIAKNYRIHHVQIRLLSVHVAGREAQVRFFQSFEVAKTNQEKEWWFADISTMKAKRSGGRWMLTEHQFNEHLH
ncbi:MAG: tetratricopeptide repeat protein [bacterium]|nr:tetratricopeptide repeat protein [bacterium]